MPQYFARGSSNKFVEKCEIVCENTSYYYNLHKNFSKFLSCHRCNNFNHAVVISLPLEDISSKNTSLRAKVANGTKIHSDIGATNKNNFGLATSISADVGLQI